MFAPDWTWSTALPVVIATVLVLWLPGLFLARGLRIGWWPSLAVAPGVTVSLFAVGGVLFHIIGVPWGLPATFFWGGLIPLVCWGVGTALERVKGRDAPLDIPRVRPLAVALAVGIAAAVAITIIVGSAPPGSMPQMPDVISHLGIAYYFLDQSTISSMVADGFNQPSNPSFYPAAFHGVAAIVVLFTGAPVIVAEAAVLLVACAFIWPVGVVFLTSVLLDARPRTIVSVGAMASAGLGFPFMLLVYGPLWPLTLAMTMLPAFITMFALMTRGVLDRGRWIVPALVLTIVSPGLFLAHTSVVFVAACVCAVLLLFALVTRAARGEGSAVRRWAPVGALLGACGLLWLASTLVAPEGMRTISYGQTSPRGALVGLLTLWSGRDDVHQLAGAFLLTLMVVGLVGVLRRPEARWLGVSWLAFFSLAAANSTVDVALTWPLTWPWYNVPVRTQAVAVLLGLPLAGLGLSSVWRLVRQRTAGLARPLALVGLVLAIAGALTVQSLGSIARITHDHSEIPQRDRLLREELDALRELSDVLPDDAVVAANPFKGVQFLPIIGPEDVLLPTETSVFLDPGKEIIAGRLDRVLEDPVVCAAVHEKGVTHAVTGGRDIWGAEGRTWPYSGIEAVSRTSGFVPDGVFGPYTLWEVPSCPS